MIILKNLWHRRAKNGWLFAELVIVTALLYFMIDFPLVGFYESSLPIGYDSDRLVLINFQSYREGVPGWTSEGDSADVNETSLMNIYNSILSHPMVETATIDTGQSLPSNGGMSSSVYRSGNKGIDSITGGISTRFYLPDTHYFETLGIKSEPGSPTPDELSLRPGDGVIITRTTAEHFWPGENGVGKRFHGWVQEGEDTVWIPVIGVVNDFRLNDYAAMSATAFEAQELRFPRRSFTVAARIREDIAPDKAASELRVWGKKNLRQGNFYLSSVELHSVKRKQIWHIGIGSQLAGMALLTAFFIISVMLGTVGNMWLQTYKREKEVGVLRSFGATRRGVMSMLLGEGAVLGLVAFIIGGFIYLQWALKYGFSGGASRSMWLLTDPVWTHDFTSHFAVLSLAVLVILELSILIGTWLPARKLSRIDPVEALRDE